MRVLVSGAQGLIGTSVQAQLVTDGHKIVTLTRSFSDDEDVITWNLLKEELDPSLLEGVEMVVHLAGENVGKGRWNSKKKKAIYDSRVFGNRVLCKALASLKKPIKLFIGASAIGYYGDRGTEVLDENQKSGKGFLSGVCRDLEKETRQLLSPETRVVNLRIGVVLSKHGGALARMIPPFFWGVGGRISTGKQYMSWVTLEDISAAIHHIIINKEIQGAVNMASPYPVTNEVFTKELGRVMKRPTIFPLPACVLRVVLGEMADELLLSSCRVKPKKLLDIDFKFKYPTIREALESMW